MPIEVVAFDVMDTLLHDPYREALEAATGLSLWELFARKPPNLYPDFECSRIGEDEYWQAYRDAGIEVDVETFHRVRRAGYAWLEGMRPLVAEVAARVTVIGATNYPPWITELQDDLAGAGCASVVASCRVGVRKPAAGFYERVATEADVPCDCVAFVDDREQNVEGARRVGMSAVRFETADQVRGWLEDRGIL